MLNYSLPIAAHNGSAENAEVVDDQMGVALPVLRQRLKSLTPRQRQVLELMKTGLTNKEIARRMGITIHTVKAHRMGVMSRMHASSFAHLIGMAQSLHKVQKAVDPEPGNMPSVTIVGFRVRRREYLIRLLRESNFTTMGVANGIELDAKWANEPTDIAIVEPELDADLEDGWHIASRILKRRTVGVILLSSQGRKFDRIKGLQIDVDACLTTPLNMDELRAMLINLGRRLRSTPISTPA